MENNNLPSYEGGIPAYNEFDPRYIPWQCNLLNDIKRFDYSKGPQEILLTGAAGSSKSLMGCHLIVKHLVDFPGASVAIGRKSSPDLRDTLWQTLISHIRCYDEGEDFNVNETRMSIQLANSSNLISRSWADRKAKKGRSLDLTMLVIEEATENDEKDEEAINELVARVGRRNNFPQFLVLFMTNPDSPSHWLYKRFFTEKKPNRHVYHSITTDNPFLPDSYIQQLESTFDSKMILRMRDGQWLDIRGETIYHAYGDHNEKDRYEVVEGIPIVWAWDFNIGEGKPMSTVFSQYIDGKKHYFDEVIIEGARTESILEEAANRGLLDYNTTYLIRGDATGTRKDTRNRLSDYEIIDKFLLNYTCKDGRRIRFRREVPSINPPIRQRHNLVNAWCKNALGDVRILIYPKAKTLREGMRLTKLKKGAEFQEDDTKHYQHCTTALGYDVHFEDLLIKRARSKGVQEI